MRRVTAAVPLAHARVDLYYRVRVMGAPARRRWLPLLGSAGRRVEGRVRNGALRLLRRVTGAQDVDI